MAPIPSSLISPDFTNVDELVLKLQDLETHFRLNGDRRFLFAQAYLITSSNIRTAIHADIFQNTDWTHRYTLCFAQLYFEALEAYETVNPTALPAAWRLSFVHAGSGQLSFFQDLLLGINAHINYDLPLALDRADVGVKLEDEHTDHLRVNEILFRSIPTILRRALKQNAPFLIPVQRFFARNMIQMTQAAFYSSRLFAWENAIALRNAKTIESRTKIFNDIEQRACRVGEKILKAPGYSRRCLEYLAIAE